jgi:putative heme-binding domain-containing protein
VTTLYRTRSEAVRKQAASVVETLGKPPADVEAKLDALLAQLTSGDAARGFQVFRSSKAACSACHRIGYVGGQVGPDLTRIGATRSRRALLEAIVFPSARLEQSYTPLRVLTTDGRVFNGMVARDSGGSMDLIISATERITLAHADIEQRLPSAVSIMPAGLEQQLSMAELADLLTLLESAR